MNFFEIRSQWVRCFSHSLPANGVQGTVGGVNEKRWGSGKTACYFEKQTRGQNLHYVRHDAPSVVCMLAYVRNN